MEVSNKGVIALSQISGGTQLYGSRTSHHYYINLRICTSEGGETMDPFDRHMPSHRPIVSVDLSMLQFAEMISSIGKGEGTPCTIKSFDGDRKPPYELPDQRASLIKYSESIEERQNEDIRSVKEQLKSILDEGKRPTKTQVSEMISSLERADSDRSSTSFIAEQTQKMFEHAVGDAKQQIDAHAMVHNIENKPVDIPKPVLAPADKYHLPGPVEKDE